MKGRQARTMATVEQHVAAPPPAVFGWLADGWHYVQWVVGTSHVRAVEPDWPAAGSRLHHAVGPWPLAVRDYTEVRAMEPDRRLQLRARGWPLGEADVDIVLTPVGAGTRVSITEQGVGGPGWLLRNPAGQALIRRRNAESLARLAALVEQRTRPVQAGDSTGGS